MQDETKTLPFVFLIGICSLIFVLIFGYFLAKIVVDYGSSIETEKLLQRTMTAASSFQPELVASLSTEPTDTNNPNSKSVRSQLLRIKKANIDSRFVYLMAKQVDNIVFLADAESPDSEEFSKPGDVYGEASPRLHAIFNNGKPFIEGPVEDKWGIWVSGHAPIVDPETNKVIAIIGIDIDASNWQKNIWVYKIFCIIITGLVCTLIISFLSSIKIINDKNLKLHKEIIERKKAEKEGENLISELQKTLREVKTLSGLVPICMHCKGIRDDKGYWNQLEKYISEHSEVQFSHGICDKCLKKYYPEVEL